MKGEVYPLRLTRLNFEEGCEVDFDNKIRPADQVLWRVLVDLNLSFN